MEIMTQSKISLWSHEHIVDAIKSLKWDQIGILVCHMNDIWVEDDWGQNFGHEYASKDQLKDGLNLKSVTVRDFLSL